MKRGNQPIQNQWAFFRALTGILCWLTGCTGLLGRGVVEEHTVVWMGQEQGLPGGGATTMVQAKDGHLWFGTFRGIARFDGVGFKVFTPSNTPELPSDGVANAFCDRSGRLWFSTYGGMASLSNGQWHRHGPEEGWTTDYARTFSEGPDGTLYITTFDGRVLRRVSDRFEEMPPVPDARLGGFGHCDSEGRFWVAKDAFIGFWEGGSWRRIEVSLKDEEERDSNTDGIGAGSARDGSMWVIHRRLLMKVNRSGVVRRMRLSQPVRAFWSLYEDRQGDVWITSRDHGALHIRIPAQNNTTHPTELIVDAIRSASGREFGAVPFIREDDEGNLWMGTASEGVARWSPRLFEVFAKADGLPHGNYRSVSFSPDGSLWIANYAGGLYRHEWIRGGGHFFRSLGWQVSAEAESVLVDRSGNVWATRFAEGGPVLSDGQGSARVAFTASGQRYARWGLYEDRQGLLWVGGPGHLLSHRRGQWRTHPLKAVHTLAESPNSGELWAGGLNGLHRLDHDVFEEVRDATGSSIPAIRALHPTPAGDLWVGTEDHGLLFRSRDGAVFHLDAEQGQPMKTITMVHVDGAGLLWLGGDLGIACLEESEALAVCSGKTPRVHTRIFGPEDGLPANCNMVHSRSPSVAQAPDGRLWFPTSRGLVRIDPRSVPRNTHPPRVLATTLVHVDANGISHEEPWSFGKNHSFAPGTRSLRFNFSALSYAAPHRVISRVRLHRDGRLVAERIGPDRSVTWDLLPPGDYSLRVAAANQTGAWSVDSEPMEFSVHPHYWQTSAFRLGLALSAIAAVAAMAASRIRRIRMASRLALAERDRIAAVDRARNAEALRQSESLRQQAEAETVWRRRREAVLRDVHDGIGGLASNLRMTVNLALRTRDENARHSLLKTMDSLVGETLVEVHGLMDTLESEIRTCGDLADEFRRHGNLMLEPHQIRLNVRTRHPETLLPKDPRFFPSLFRIYKEAIANIVKHARCSQVEVTVDASIASLGVVISDDGIGLPSRPSPGRGLANMRKRAVELGGHLTLLHQDGLRLELVIPWSGTESTGSSNTPAASDPGDRNPA